MKTRPRSARRLASAPDVLDDALAGPVRGMRLAGEHDLDGPLRIPEDPGQPLLVGEEQRGSLVGREAAREADGERVRVHHLADARAVRPATRRAEPAVSASGRGRSGPARASGGSGRSTAGGRRPRPGSPRIGGRGRPRRDRPGPRRAPGTGFGSGRPTQLGTWIPFVMPRMGWSRMGRHVAFAVCACSLLTAFAPFVRRRLKAVMSNSPTAPSTPRPSSRMRSRSTPSSPDRGRRRGAPGWRRSARCRRTRACGS